MVTPAEDIETATENQGQIENVKESIVELKQMKAKAKSCSVH